MSLLSIFFVFQKKYPKLGSLYIWFEATKINSLIIKIIIIIEITINQSINSNQPQDLSCHSPPVTLALASRHRSSHRCIQLASFCRSNHRVQCAWQHGHVGYRNSASARCQLQRPCPIAHNQHQPSALVPPPGSNHAITLDALAVAVIVTRPRWLAHNQPFALRLRLSQRQLLGEPCNQPCTPVLHGGQRLAPFQWNQLQFVQIAHDYASMLYGAR